jgi:hypothetical protein
MVKQITHPYQPRPIRFLKLWQVNGWTVKVYGMAATNERSPQRLVETAKAIARQQLPQPAITSERYGAAILIAHAGTDGNYVLVDWWFGENMLHHHVYASSLAEPDTFIYVSPQGVGFCGWELAVFQFERQAWIDMVLARPTTPDFNAYFAQHLNADV